MLVTLFAIGLFACTAVDTVFSVFGVLILLLLFDVLFVVLFECKFLLIVLILTPIIGVGDLTLCIVLVFLFGVLYNDCFAFSRFICNVRFSCNCNCVCCLLFCIDCFGNVFVFLFVKSIVLSIVVSILSISVKLSRLSKFNTALFKFSCATTLTLVLEFEFSRFLFLRLDSTLLPLLVDLMAIPSRLP